MPKFPVDAPKKRVKKVPGTGFNSIKINGIV